MLACAWVAAAVPVSAQGISERPPRTAEVVQVLENSQWTELFPGILHIAIDTALGTRITALKISPQNHHFSVLQQNKPEGETAAEFAAREDAVIVINGGFFASDENGKLTPVGELIDDGKPQSGKWKDSGGHLGLFEDGIRIIPTGKEFEEVPREAIQSKPLIIEPGKKWALNTNLGNLRERTMVCIRNRKEIVLLMVSGQGLSLFEAGWIMRGPEWGGWLDCDSAIALDGGGSTQLHVKDRPDLAITGATPVQNALVIKAR